MPIKSTIEHEDGQTRNILAEITRTRKEFFRHLENCPQYAEISGKRPFLSNAIREINKGRKGHMAIIAELKFASPSAGVIRKQHDLEQILTQVQNGGACGISVLTEPTYFDGSFENLRAAAIKTTLPLLMKDFLVTAYQVRAGRACGASNILVIASICDLPTFMPLIKTNHLEPLVEIHSGAEIPLIEKVRPTLVGINNRNLQDLKIDFETSRRVIPMVRDVLGDNVMIISESGVKSRRDVELLRSYGADGFLVGSSLMETENISEKLQELVG